MALNSYRRHGSHCPGGRALHEMTYEADELRRNWKKCSCPIYASGTLHGQFKRKNTERSGWPEAKAIVSEWESAGSWSGKAHPIEPKPVAPPLSDSASARISIADAVKAYLAVRSGSGIVSATLRKHRTFVKQLEEFAAARGYVMLEQLTSADIDMFYAGWKLGARTKAKRLGTLRSFFRFCAKRKWVAVDPTDPKSVGPISSDLKPPIGANRAANKIPFTDEELQRIIHACDQLEPISWTNGKTGGVWTGNDVKDFILVLVYTGLRISDVGLFNISRLKGNEVFLRAKKNGGDVFTWIPDWLRDLLRELANQRGPRPFIAGRSDWLETVTDLWRRKINRVFELAGEFEETPTPHRFRHTFARILLQRGVPVADVADLLGDDEDTVREHYARWVPERQARLTSILREAFVDKPKPKLVSIPGRRK
jgi:integrase/recombinase XerD